MHIGPQYACIFVSNMRCILCALQCSLGVCKKGTQYALHIGSQYACILAPNMHAYWRPICMHIDAKCALHIGRVRVPGNCANVDPKTTTPRRVAQWQPICQIVKTSLEFVYAYCIFMSSKTISYSRYHHSNICRDSAM